MTNNTLPSTPKLRAALHGLLKDADLEALTQKHARLYIQKKFNLSDVLIGDQGTKEKLKGILVEEMENVEATNGNNEDDVDSDDDMVDTNIKKRKGEPLANLDAVKRNKKYEIRKGKDTKQNQSESESEGSSESDFDSELKDENENEKKIVTKTEGKKERDPVKTKKDKPKKETKETPLVNEKVERLKRYIRECGAMKPYCRLLAGLTIKEQIAKLMEILRELGVEGTPTLKKCKDAKIKRDEEKELADLQLENIIVGSRRTRGVPIDGPPRKLLQSAVISSDDSSASDDDATTSREPDLSFLTEGSDSGEEEDKNANQSPEGPVIVGSSQLAAELFSDDD